MRLLVAPDGQGGIPGELVIPLDGGCQFCSLRFSGLSSGNDYTSAVSRDLPYTEADLRAAAENAFLRGTDGPDGRPTHQFLVAAVSAMQQYGQMWPADFEVACCAFDAVLQAQVQGPANRAERRAAKRKRGRRG